ncbi:MAG: hypothetical protein ACJ72D_04905 [Marmoricola sp.]
MVSPESQVRSESRTFPGVCARYVPFARATVQGETCIAETCKIRQGQPRRARSNVSGLRPITWRTSSDKRAQLKIAECVDYAREVGAATSLAIHDAV